MQALVLFALLTLICLQSYALVCYNGGSLTDNNYKPNDTIACLTNTKLCFKTTFNTKDQKGAAFGCDEAGTCAQNSLKSGKCHSEKGVTLCCCDSDKCNSSRFPAVFTAAFLPLLVKFLY